MSDLRKISGDKFFQTMDDVVGNLGHRVWWHGKPGIGKSAMTKQWAQAQAKTKELTFHDLTMGPLAEGTDPATVYGFIDLRLALLDVLDIKGAPYLDEKAEITRYLANSILPRIDAHGHQGVLFLDEFAAGATMVTNAISQLVLDRHIGDSYVFPDGWKIVAASNLASDNAAINKVGSHILNRFDHYELVENPDAFAYYLIDKANSNGNGKKLEAYTSVAFFCRWKKELLHRYTRGDIAYPSPRKWEEVAEIVHAFDDQEKRELYVSGKVGEGPTAELEGYLSIAASLVTIRQVERDPMTAPVPEYGSDSACAAMFAITGMLVNEVTDKNVDAVFAYVSRFPEEFGAVFACDLIKRKPDLQDTVAFSTWRQDHPSVSL